MADISPITIARFWSKVAVSANNHECWEWKGGFNGSGYGNFRIPEFGRSTTYSAHRVAYLIINGEFPPEGMLVRHRCDNPKCVNPYHLEHGSNADNTHDMMERGRYVPRANQGGTANPRAKLSARDVDEIRRMIASGHSNTKIASRFGVSHATISAIRRGKSWATPPSLSHGRAG